MEDTGRRPRIILGVTGSVACVKVPEIVCLLRSLNAEVKLVLTGNSRHFMDRANEYNSTAWSEMHRLDPSVELLNDVDEYSCWNRVGDPVLHVQVFGVASRPTRYFTSDLASIGSCGDGRTSC
jgi:phosphopantothenoylcysteine decarboxylase